MDTVKKSAGRPPGAKAADPDAEVDRLILNRRDQEEDARDEANTRARYIFKQQHQRAERRRAWIEYHDRACRTHQGLADQHYLAKVELERGVWE